MRIEIESGDWRREGDRLVFDVPAGSMVTRATHPNGLTYKTLAVFTSDGIFSIPANTVVSDGTWTVKNDED